MQCPECKSTHIRKNGKQKGKQNHICAECRRQFITDCELNSGDSDDLKRLCLKMHVNGMDFRRIERVTGVHRTMVLSWLKQVGELDELETLVGSKKTKSGFELL